MTRIDRRARSISSCGSVSPLVALAVAIVLAGTANTVRSHHSGFQVQDARKKLDEMLVKTVGDVVWIGDAAVSAPFVTRTRVAQMHEPEVIPLEGGILPLEVFVQDAVLPNCGAARREFNLRFVLSGLNGEYVTVTKGVNTHEPGKAALTLELPVPTAAAQTAAYPQASASMPATRVVANEPLRRIVLGSAEAQTHDFTRTVTRQLSAGFGVNPGKALVLRAYVAQWERLARFRGKALVDGELTAALASARGKKFASDLLSAEQRTLEVAGQVKSFQLSELMVTQVERDLRPEDCDAGKPKTDLMRLKLEAPPGLASLGTWSFLLRDAKAETIAPIDLKRNVGGALGFPGVGAGMICHVSACGEGAPGTRRIVRMAETRSCSIAYSLPDPACATARQP